MELPVAGDLVTIATAGAPMDGIVVDVPSVAKTVVAIVDRKRGPVMRTFNAEALTLRPDASPDDRALQLLIRRTPAAVSKAARGGSGPQAGRAGHTRGAVHRSTGK